MYPAAGAEGPPQLQILTLAREDDRQRRRRCSACEALYEQVLRWSARPDNREFMLVEPRQRLEAFCIRSALVSLPVSFSTRLQFLAAVGTRPRTVAALRGVVTLRLATFCG